jgi:hypothetical protein
MPSFPTVIRRSSRASLISNDDTSDGNRSDTASVNGSINNTTSKRRWLPKVRPGASAEIQAEPESDMNLSKSRSSLNQSGSVNPVHKKLWTNRQRSQTESESPEEQVAKLREENVAMANDLEVVRGQLMLREQELDQAKLHGTQIEEKYDAMMKDLENAKGEAVIQEEEIKEMKLHHAATEEKYEALLKDWENAKEEAVIQLKGLVGENEALRDGLKELEGKTEALRNGLKKVQGDLNDLRTKIGQGLFSPVVKWYTGVKC